MSALEEPVGAGAGDRAEALSAELVIANPSGLHARPAALFVRTAAGFVARVTVRNLDRPGSTADAKSILAVLGLGVSSGHRIVVAATGSDAVGAVDALVALVASGIGEAPEAAEAAGGLEAS